jgi:transcription initiation factor TFIIIB Brf1 subunit/transcription initiation factor TFIIB
MNEQFGGNSYVETVPGYSDHHGPSSDPMFPKNSLGTLISGNSRLARLNMWVSVDSFEKQLKEEIDFLVKTLDTLDSHTINCVVLMYKRISELYHDNNIKKSKIKVYSYVIFHTLKRIQMVSHQTVSNLLSIDSKLVCKALKNVDQFVIKHQKCEQKVFFHVYSLDNFNIDETIKEKINEMYSSIKDDTRFDKHKPNSLLAGIVFFFSLKYKIELDRQHISFIAGVSETTVFQVYKKILESQQ